MTAPRPPVAGPARRLGGRPAAPPVRTGWDAPPESHQGPLDDHVDVEAPVLAGGPPAVLVRGVDGVYRPAHLADAVAEHQRGDVTHLLDTTPTVVPPGVRVGEHVIVLAGPDTGAVYRVED